MQISGCLALEIRGNDYKGLTSRATTSTHDVLTMSVTVRKTFLGVPCCYVHGIHLPVPTS